MTIQAKDVPYSWIRNELVFKGDIARGQTNKRVKLIQELVTLQGSAIAIDGDFGAATFDALRQFQSENGLPQTGIADERTFTALIQPVLRALTPIEGFQGSYNELVVAYARQHLAEHPREVGGQNCGPWVRTYMKGNEGRQWPWCAGFVCFILGQAADTSAGAIPIEPSFSCDILAAEAREERLLKSDRQIATDQTSPPRLAPGTVFLVRRTTTDWTHTGFVIDSRDETFTTIEGNTNDDGDREGYEVCARLRNYDSKDFIVYA